jgi:hypothetical protein
MPKYQKPVFWIKAVAAIVKLFYALASILLSPRAQVAWNHKIRK